MFSYQPSGKKNPSTTKDAYLKKNSPFYCWFVDVFFSILSEVSELKMK